MRHLIRAFRTEARVYRAVIADPRCPRLSRWLLGGALLYAVSPIDLIPDFIPVLGQLDDLFLLPVLVWLALRAIPNALLAEHRAAYPSYRAPASASAQPGQPRLRLSADRRRPSATTGPGPR